MNKIALGERATESKKKKLRDSHGVIDIQR